MGKFTDTHIYYVQKFEINVLEATLTLIGQGSWMLLECGGELNLWILSKDVVLAVQYKVYIEE